MTEKFSLNEGEKLVKLARKAISFQLSTGRQYFEPAPEKRFEERRGVFTTLNTYPENGLRGCIGLPYPDEKVWNAVMSSASSAAFSDPRFPQVSASEFENITVEVSILTKPRPLDKKKLEGEIKIGKTGLIIQGKGRSGLLLPQVASDYGWDMETFLEQACLKAGLQKNAWKELDVQILGFEAQVFHEKEPEGKVEEA